MSNGTPMAPRPSMRFERVEVARVITMERQRDVDAQHVARLADSFELFGGQLQPIVVTEEMVLIDGAHRLDAARSLGWTHLDAGIASHVESEEDRAFLEAEANAARRELTLSQKKVLWETLIEPRYRAEASQRRRAAQNNSSSGKFPELGPAWSGETTDLANAFVGVSTKTLTKLDQLERWETDESLPAPVREAAAQAIVRADKTNKVDGEHRRVESMVALSSVSGDVQALQAAESLVSKVIGTVMKAAQDAKRFDRDELLQALRADPSAGEDWAGVVASARWLLEFVEDLADDAGIRVGVAA